jgi:cysteine desulfurase
LAESYGYEVTVINADSEGVVSKGALDDALRADTLLVSIQAANNEIGTIQAISELSEISRSRGALFHCDAAQAAGRVTIDVDDWGADLLSLSGHKMYGPKGIGALYLRGGVRGLPIAPLSVGGGHEGELRPGTHNVPAIVGFGIAAKLCLELTAEEAKRMCELRNQLEKGLLELIPVMQVNGCIDNRLPNNTSITLPGIDAGALINNLPQLSISTGSACMSGAIEPSYVLQAIGLNRNDADSTIRIGLGRFSTSEEITEACGYIAESYYDMKKLELQFM